jgi:hypothetical protein
VRSLDEIDADLREVNDAINDLYWTFTRCARGKPPAVVRPDLYTTRRALERERTAARAALKGSTMTTTTAQTVIECPLALDELIADIPRNVAIAAHNGTSHTPDERGDGERRAYAANLRMAWDNLAKHADTPEKVAILTAEWQTFREGYAHRVLEYLRARSRCLSVLVTGAARFPTARNAKANNIADKRAKEACEYYGAGIQTIARILRPELRPIMSGDHDAIERLKEKIAVLEAMHERMKAANMAIRKHAKKGADAQLAALLALGLAEELARKALEPDPMGRVGFPAYAITNNGAEIRRLRARLAEVERAAVAEVETFEGAIAKYEDDPGANRVRLYYPGKPDDATRARLKSGGFRWTPTIEAWQAYRNPRAIAIAKREAGPCRYCDDEGTIENTVDLGGPPEVACDCPAGKAGRDAETHEADPEVYACPDGASCVDPECIAENTRRTEAA